MKFLVLLIAPLLAAASPVDSTTNTAAAPQRKECDAYYGRRWDSRPECGRHRELYERVCKTCHGRRHPDCVVEVDESCVHR